jgi:CRISPR-associated protein Cmr2
MKSVEKQNGKIVFPIPDARFMDGLETGKCDIKQGTIPNRFKACVPLDFKPEYVERDVKHAWNALAEYLYDNDLLKIDSEKTRTIWKRQIDSFWEISWAIMDNEADSSIIDRLKNWRVHLPPDEPGVKCMMMEGWQELSGIETPHSEGLGKFWKRVRNQEQKGMKTDLRKNEHLCSIAFVKRRFARYFANFNTFMPGGWQLHGWELPNGVPSVHYMAAAPWLAKLVGSANQSNAVAKQMWEFHDAAHKLTGNYGEWRSNILCVREATEKNAQKKWAALDGTVFFDSMLENPNLWDEEQKKQAEKVLFQLKQVRDKGELDSVSPFYAVLMMDGDQLGIHMSDLNNQEKITNGLAKFTSTVQTIVEAYSGFLVYAGGDDVLALFPLEFAFSCAVALRNHYTECFLKTGIRTSLSGAVEFAHIKMPLGKVLHDAHDLLDNVAKDGRGRDAIACRVWKPGGLAIEWAMPWDCALEYGKDRLCIEKLADDFRQSFQCPKKDKAGRDTDSEKQGRFSNKFFFKISERFTLLNPRECRYLSEEEHLTAEERHKPILHTEQAIDLLAADYINSGMASKLTLDEARKIIRPLLEQCRPVMRNLNKKSVEMKKSSCLDVDGALLVRFLAQKGVEQ